MSTDLLLAAEILEEHAGPGSAEPANAIAPLLVGPLLMLRACALECALKACYLFDGNRLFTEGGKLVQPTAVLTKRPHELVEWARLALRSRFEATAADEAGLVWLSHFIERGRYPVPKRDPNVAGRTEVWSRADEDWFWSFMERLRPFVRTILGPSDSTL